MSKVLAFDFGASSGRAILAQYESGKLTYSEVHRFDNNPIEQNGHLCWDFDDLLQNVHEGIAKAGSFDSIAFDTWGVDYGIIGEDGKLTSSPIHYRDARTQGAIEKAAAIMPQEELYAHTGNQLMAFNTLFQLLTDELRDAYKILFMPDLFGYMLCGKAVCDETIASTSQLMSPLTRSWSKEVQAAYNIRPELLCDIVKSGTVIGEYKGAKVVAVAGHDTQCAVAAMPTDEDKVAFLSCGTWSLLGTELSEPILSQQSMHSELSNELGANGKINYLKNITGLWLIQESRREYKRRGEEYSYADLERLALKAQPLRCFIDPDAPEFALPGDLPARVCEYCRKTGQYVPQTVGEVMVCIYESLALKYRHALCQLTLLTHKSFDVLHILGGGTKDKLLCQMTANSIALPVVAGPIEATALGNIIIQLTALGELENIDAGRRLIAQTETLTRYTPKDTSSWDKAYAFYKTIL